MAKKPTKTEMINNYIKNNRDDIKKKLRKNKYEKVEEEYNFEEKIKSIIPCSTCIVRACCVEKFETNRFSFSADCPILKTFNDAIWYILINKTIYKESNDYERRIFRYVKKKVREGKIRL